MLSRRAMLVGAVGAMAAPVIVRAQSWPADTIHLIVPFPAGGPTDHAARLVSERYGPALGTSVVVENYAGVGGSVGVRRLAEAKADGYTIGLGTTGTHAINASLYAQLPYDPIKDFIPLSRINRGASVLVVPSSSKFQTLNDLVKFARANPDQVTFSSAGNGSSNHLAGQMLAIGTDTKMRHIPYKGTGQASLDVIAGRITFVFDSIQTALPQIKAGALRPLAWAGETRHPDLPDVPSLSESYPGMAVPNWMALFAPAGVPTEVANRLSTTLFNVLNEQELFSKMTAQGFDPEPTTSAEMSEIIAADIDRYRPAVESAGLKL